MGSNLTGSHDPKFPLVLPQNDLTIKNASLILDDSLSKIPVNHNFQFIIQGRAIR